MADEHAASAAQTIIFAAFRIACPSLEGRISAFSDIIHAIAGERASRLERRELTRQLEASADKLEMRLSALEEHEFTGLEEGDKAAAIAAVCDAVDALKITKQTVIDENADPDAIFARLLPVATHQWADAYVSSAGIEYGRKFLLEASRFIVHIVRDMPDFTANVGVAALAVAKRTLQLLEASIRLVVLPRYRPGTAGEASSFEADYRSDIIQRNKDVELFGMPIPIKELRRQPLDIAYITLSVSSVTPLAKARIARLQPNPEAPPLTHSYQAAVDTAIATVVRGRVGSVSRDSRAGQVSVSVSDGVRILITGPAGSGKTTLTQWLAMRSAERGFQDELAQWNNTIPFVLRLRSLFRAEMTEAPDIIGIIERAVGRASSRPGDWVEKQLKERQVVLVLDGLDEVSEYQLPVALNWIAQAIAEYPTVNLIVTSRPDGLDQRWFGRNNFTTLSLNAMSAIGIERCVTSWFRAVSAITAESRDELAARQRQLLRDVHNRAPVRELAATPLVCAMLCAFYAYEVAESVPDSRDDLYEQVIETLIDRRDRKRHAIEPDRRSFTCGQKLTLLQAIARYLTEQQTLTIATYKRMIGADDGRSSGRTTALACIETEAAGMATLTLTPWEALDYLLRRSVIFREVGQGEGQFVHRSIQEFLTARSFAEDGRVDLLAEHLGSEQWNRIIAFAAGRLDSRSASVLLKAILDKAEAPSAKQRDLLLLVAECLSTVKVDPEIVKRATTALAMILPPQSLREAEILGRSGVGVIGWLSKFRASDDEIAARCIYAAAVSGSQAGLSVIAEYLPVARASVVKRTILDAWQYFDADEFAELVLSRLELSDEVVRIFDEDTFAAAPLIEDLSRVAIEVRSGALDFSRWSSLARLKDLDCSAFRGLGSLDGIGEIPNLRSLNLSGRANLIDFDQLAGCRSLVELWLDSCSGLSDLGFLGVLDRLRALSLEDCSNVSEFSILGTLPRLLTLKLSGCRIQSADFFARLSALQNLGLETMGGWSDLSPLARCINLRRLSISLALGRPSPIEFDGFSALRALRLSGWPVVPDLGTAVRLHGLTELQVVDMQGLKDFGPLGQLSGLRRLRLNDCRDLRRCAGIERLEFLEDLDLSGSAISYPDIPRSMSRLKRINFDRCENLSDIEHLFALPGLEELILPPVDSEVLTAMQRRAANPALRVICSPIPGGYETG